MWAFSAKRPKDTDGSAEWLAYPLKGLTNADLCPFLSKLSYERTQRNGTTSYGERRKRTNVLL